MLTNKSESNLSKTYVYQVDERLKIYNLLQCKIKWFRIKGRKIKKLIYTNEEIIFWRYVSKCVPLKIRFHT